MATETLDRLVAIVREVYEATTMSEVALAVTADKTEGLEGLLWPDWTGPQPPSFRNEVMGVPPPIDNPCPRCDVGALYEKNNRLWCNNHNCGWRSSLGDV